MNYVSMTGTADIKTNSVTLASAQASGAGGSLDVGTDTVVGTSLTFFLAGTSTVLATSSAPALSSYRGASGTATYYVATGIQGSTAFPPVVWSTPAWASPAAFTAPSALLAAAMMVAALFMKL